MNNYCSYACPYASARGRGACNTFNLIYCSKYRREVDKGQSCLDNLVKGAKKK